MQVVKKYVKNIKEEKRYVNYDMNDESFARLFQFFLIELKNNTGFSKSKMRRALTLTIRKWTEKPPQMISKTVLDHFILNYPNVNPYDARFRPRNRWGIDVIFEHTTPVNLFVTDLFKSKDINDIRRVMNEYSGMSIITKDEDVCLHNRGFSRVRPQGWRQSYTECSIDVMDENQFNIYKQEKLNSQDID